MTSKGFTKQDIDQNPEFYISVAVDESPLVWMQPVADPFVKQIVRISWWDRFTSLFRREFTVQVSVTGNSAAVFNTMVARRYSRINFSRIWNKGLEEDSGERIESVEFGSNG